MPPNAIVAAAKPSKIANLPRLASESAPQPVAGGTMSLSRVKGAYGIGPSAATSERSIR
ncbi:hypothetical protein [Amycolatopsis pretoriensis]|uniref:hypothetical protein n=1 Tax=Amycolatopsis pretoriensis TaxID=218821 RepID=UPI001302514C|nr:hypothetical protein [Amycolatopsis pretoriensis]